MTSTHAELDAFYEGYEAAVRDYAVWRDGEQLVGALERPLREVLDRLQVTRAQAHAELTRRTE